MLGGDYELLQISLSLGSKPSSSSSSCFIPSILASLRSWVTSFAQPTSQIPPVNAISQCTSWVTSVSPGSSIARWLVGGGGGAKILRLSQPSSKKKLNRRFRYFCFNHDTLEWLVIRFGSTCPMNSLFKSVLFLSRS